MVCYSTTMLVHSCAVCVTSDMAVSVGNMDGTAESGSAFASYCMDFYGETTAQHSTDMSVIA